MGGRPAPRARHNHADEADDGEHLREVQHRERSELILRSQEEDGRESEQAEPRPVLRLSLRSTGRTMRQSLVANAGSSWRVAASADAGTRPCRRCGVRHSRTPALKVRRSFIATPREPPRPGQTGARSGRRRTRAHRERRASCQALTAFRSGRFIGTRAAARPVLRCSRNAP